MNLGCFGGWERELVNEIRFVDQLKNLVERRGEERKEVERKEKKNIYSST